MREIKEKKEYESILISIRRQHETTAARSDGIWRVPWECGGGRLQTSIGAHQLVLRRPDDA